MEFIGAVNYFFELGLKNGHKRLIANPEDYLNGRLLFKSEVAIEAINAFQWGFYLGQELTEKEYNVLTPIKKSGILKKKAKKDEELFNTKLEGNC